MNAVRPYPRRAPAARAVPLLALALVAGACATTPTVAPGPPAPEPGLYGVAGGRLVRIEPPGGVEISGQVADVRGLTYDAEARRFYAIADASTKPRLITIDPVSGEAATIGLIAAPRLVLTLAEALTLDPRDGTLYLAGGDSSFASSVLFTVDPATGAAKQVARIRGTVQSEADAMVFVDDALYAVDGAANSSALYRIDPVTGQAQRLSQPFDHTLTDLAFDPASRRLFGAPSAGGALLALALDGAGVGESGATTEPLTALAIIPAPGGASLFGDGFESGDASAWSQRSKQER